MFRAFFDESGLNPEEDKVLVVAGFLGRVEEWEKAADAWDECLHDSLRIEFFKHHEAQSLDGQFRGLKREQADAKVLALARVITKFKLLSFCVGVPYEALSSRKRRISQKVMGARFYDWGFLASTKGVLQYVHHAYPGERVDFVFDERTELRACIQAYYEMKADPDNEIMRCAGQCDPGTDIDFLPLQMADLLAWECSYTVKTESMTDSFDEIMCSNGVVTIPCQPPPLLNPTLELAKLGQDVQRAAADILRRFYRENERSLELAADTLDLVQQKAYFDIALKRLSSLYEQDEEYRRFKEKQDSEELEGQS